MHGSWANSAERSSACRGDWPVARAFRIRISVDRTTIISRFTPFAVEIDFAGLLHDLGINDRFARHSVAVTRIKAPERQMPIPHAMSEVFAWEDKGDISWVIEDPGQLEYYIYFDVETHGPFDPPEKIALVGNGDVLRYNSGGPEPFDVGIPVQMPVLVDWDGDGKLDVLQGTTYANTLGFPYRGTWFFRNIGTNENPLYDDFIRLKVDEDFIDSQVFDAVDWDGDGLIDLVGKPYGRDEIHVYLNTGKKDRNRLPVLTKGPVTDLSKMTGLGGQCGIEMAQLFDLHGDGRLHLIAVVRELADKSETGHVVGSYYDNYILVFENNQPPGRPPQFKNPYRLKTADGKPLTLKGGAGGSMGDWNGDGVWDVLLEETQGSEQRIRLFRNVGTNLKPQLVDAGLLAGGKYLALGARYYRNPLYTGFILFEKSWWFRYLKDVGKKPGDPILRDQGYLMQRNGRVSIGTYAWPCACDWDGDGGRDIVSGSCTGSPYVLEEVGRSDPPVYRPRRILEAEGKPIWHTWGNTLTQTGGERTEGYWRPVIVDWDDDGLDDMLIPVGISHSKLVNGKWFPEGRLLFYKNIGTRDQPRYAASREILLEDGSPPVGSNNIFPMDWDGDGRLELVGFDFHGRLCVFRPKDPLTLSPGNPLKMADGGDFCWEVVWKFLGRPWGVEFAVCDWDRRGVWDVVVGTREMMLLFRNHGTNLDTAYEPGERIKLWGRPIEHSVHCLRPWPVDWDGTGRTDLLVGSESGWFHLFRRPALEGDRPKAMVGRLESKKLD